MLTTGFTTRPLSDNYTITLQEVTYARVIVDQNNTERVLINGVPVLNKIAEILPADGTICKELHLEIRFESDIIPTVSPVRQIYLQYKKIIKAC